MSVSSHRRGVVQGDIFSPVCFIIALECLMRRSDKDGEVTVLGVLLSRLEFADDAALIDESIDQASERISSIAKGSRERADMEVRIDKTETMFPRDVTFNYRRRTLQFVRSTNESDKINVCFFLGTILIGGHIG